MHRAGRLHLAMLNAEAKWMLLRTVALWKRRPFAELHALMHRAQRIETFGRRGERYDLEVHIARNDTPGHEGELRLHVTVDRGGWLGIFAMSYEVSLLPPALDIDAQARPAAPVALCEVKDELPAPEPATPVTPATSATQPVAAAA